MNKEDPKKLNEEIRLLRKRIKELEEAQTRANGIQESTKKYDALFNNINIGLALHEIIVDENGKPIDFVFLDVNPAFEKITALKKKDIVGKRSLESIPYIKQKRIETYGKVALTRKPVSYVDYSEKLKRFIDIKVFSPAENQFAIAIFDISDQIKAKQKLILNEEKYRALLENVGAGISYFDLEGNVILFNKQAANNLQCKPEDLIGKSIYKIFGEADGSIIHKRILASAKSKDFMEYKDKINLPSGTKWLQSKYNKIQNNEGNIIGVQIISTDITEIKQNKEKLQRLFDNMITGFIYCKIVFNNDGQAIDGIFLEANKAYEQMAGLANKNIIGTKLSDIKTEIKNNPIKHMDFYHQILNGNPVRFEEYFKERNAWYSINTYSPQDGYFAALIEDITENKQAEIARKSASLKLRELNRRFVLAADSAGFGVWELDLVHNKLHWDKWMFKIYGIKREDFGEAYEAWKKGVHPQDIEKANEEVEQAIRGEKEFDSEFRIIRPDGDVRYIQANAAIVRNKQGQAIRMIGINYDITRTKRAEKELIAAKEKAEESDRLKSAFLANMSHEIRTPMNGILGFASLLHDPELSGNEIKIYSDIIQRSGKRMLNIINDLMDISKIEAGQMDVSFSAVDIMELIDYLYNFFKLEIENKGLQLYLKITKTKKPVILWTDKEKLSAILSNLIKNAFKYTHRGHIEIGFTLEEDGNNDPSSISFYVKDTGIGIPEDRHSAIFERFVQADIEDKTASEGAGLGLAISKAYAEMIHGHIWVESQFGKGSKFCLSLPYQEQKTSNKPLNTEKIIVSGTQADPLKLKILIAEDDETSQEHLSILLEDIADTIIHVNNGKDAVEEYRKNPDIDLVLMDLKMPIMNGFEATTSIRAFNSELIIIAQTAYALAGDREKAINAGCTDYITKPINKDTLFELLHFYF